jgi:hypothetical protein
MPEILRFPHNDLSPEAIDVKARDVRGACLLVLANNPEPTAAGKSLAANCCVLPLQPQRRASNSAQPPSPRTVLNWSGE